MLDFQSSAHYGLSCFIALLPVTVWKWLWVSSSQLWRITTSNKGNDFSICLGEAMAWCKEAMLKACFTRPLNRFCAEVFLSHALGLGTLAKTQEEKGSFPASPAFLPSFLHNTEISKWKTMSCSKRVANSLGQQASVKGRVQFPVFSEFWALFSVGRTSMENISRQTGGCWACWVSVGCRFTHPWVVISSSHHQHLLSVVFGCSHGPGAASEPSVLCCMSKRAGDSDSRQSLPLYWDFNEVV